MGAIWSKNTQSRKNSSSKQNNVQITVEDMNNLYKALYEYQANAPDEINFKQNDRLLVLQESDPNNPWWKVRNLETDQVGVGPSNYMRKGNVSKFEGWMDNVNRNDAVRLLLRAGLPEGTFLVRPNAKQIDGIELLLALSVRYKDKSKQNTFLVKHYPIMSRNGTEDFYIHNARKLPTVAHLLESYKSGGLCCKLSGPCPIDPPVVQFKDIEVNRDCLTMIRKLGSGSFGDVWLAKWNNVLNVAVKSLKLNAAMTPEKFLEEAKIMHKLSHDKIVTIMGVCSEIVDAEQDILIITEFMENGALLEYLRKMNSPCIPDRPTVDVLLDMIYQIADGMAFLEAKHFVHRDLRAANVLIGKSNFVKIGNFGLARFVQEDDIYQADSETNKFPVKWTAPEAMFDIRFTTKSDVWSFGVLMYEILTMGSSVYQNMSNKDVMQYVRSPRNRLPQPQTQWMDEKDMKRVSIIYKEYMLKCWDANADDRPTFHSLKIDFEDIDTILVDLLDGIFFHGIS